MRGAVTVKLVTPRFPGARFAEYLVDLDEGGAADVAPTGHEHFVYLLAGEVEVEVELAAGERSVELRSGGFAYLPADALLGFHSRGRRGARVLWLKRRYEPAPGLAAPRAQWGHRDDEPFEVLPIPGLTRRELLPPLDPAFDFNISLLRFAPGSALDRVEIHDEEHGLYMTAGEGVYYLEGSYREVREGDFIYMAPYCPQSFRAAGLEDAEYLLYKDVFRDGF